ncbi:MAG: Uma2 family endonuclease [Planctomycetaceae bacterium]
MSATIDRLSVIDYLRAERASELKHEFHEGEVAVMVGGSLRHAKIITNLVNVFSELLTDKDADVLSQALRVRVDAADLYTYPDVIIVCGSPVLEDAHNDTLMNPTVIIEVLSPSTEAYDRGQKFGYYRQIPSLQEYVLVAQHQPLIDHFLRQESGSWVIRNGCERIDQVLKLQTLELEVPLRRIYHRIDFQH